MADNSQWKNRAQELFQVCQDELKRATIIGKKMISASKTNSALHEAYEELGVLAFQEIKEEKLKWENPKLEEILKAIEQLEAELEKIEGEVSDAKKNDFE